jgi:two-component system response regulator DesR
MKFTPESPCKVLVLYPDLLIRAGIVASLRKHVVFDVLESTSLTEAPNFDAFDVVIADYDQAMQLTDPPATQKRSSQGRVLIATDNERAGDIQRAIRSGVQGYILLNGPLSDLVDGVLAVARGSRYLSAKAAQRMADILAHEALTARELEVLALVVAGGSKQGDRSPARHRDRNRQDPHARHLREAPGDFSNPGRPDRVHPWPRRRTRARSVRAALPGILTARVRDSSGRLSASATAPPRAAKGRFSSTHDGPGSAQGPALSMARIWSFPCNAF